MFWKDGLFKKPHWNMIFLVVLSGKMIFLFPENMILFFRRKMKGDLSQKSTWKYDIFIKWKDDFSKKKEKKLRWDMIFLVLSGKMVIFFRKIWSFYFRWKKKDKFSQGINGSMIFSVYMYKCYKYDITFLQKKKKKNQRWCLPEKIHLKVIDILDRILDRVPKIICAFIETFISVLIYCFPVKKTRKLNM